MHVFLLLVSGSAFMLVEVDEKFGWQLNIIVLPAAFAVIRPHKSEIANHSGVCLTALLAALLLNVDIAPVPVKKV